MKIYSKEGIVLTEVSKFQYQGTYMGESFLSFDIDSPEPLSLKIGDYCEYRGERFELNYVPAKEKRASAKSIGEAFKYKGLKFNSLADELTRCDFLDFVLNDNQIHFSNLPTFSFYAASVKELADRILANLNRIYQGDRQWSIEIEDSFTSSAQNVAANNIKCWDALQLVNTLFKGNFVIKGRNIKIGTSGLVIEKIFSYGKDNGLFTIEQQTNDNALIITRLRAYGSERNLPDRYYNNLKDSEGNFLIPESQYVKNLMLPSFAENGGDAYIDSPEIEKLGIREGTVFFDGSDTSLPDIYPSLEDMTAEELKAAGFQTESTGELDVIVSAEQVKDNGEPPLEGQGQKIQGTFWLNIKDVGFDINDHLTTETAQISMKTGMCAGRSFDITKCEKIGTGYKLTLNREEDSDLDLYFPYNRYNIKTGDKFVLLNIEMPEVYIKTAEQKLLKYATDYLNNNDKSKYTYIPKIDNVFMARNPQFHDTIKEGDIFNFNDTDLGIEASVIIQSLTIKEGGIIPEYDIVLFNDKITTGTIEKIQNAITSLANNIGITADQAKGIFRIMIDAWYPNWFDQKLHTFDEVKFKRVTAEEFIERLEDADTDTQEAIRTGEAVSYLLTEISESGDIPVSPTTLGELQNVDKSANEVLQEDVVLVKLAGSDTWTQKKLSEIGGGGSEPGIQRNIRIVNNLDSKNISASKGEPCYLNFTFISQERYSSDEAYEDTGERGLLQISARSGENAEYVVVKQIYISSGTPVSVDVAEYLVSGANNIMIKVTGEVTEVTTPAFVYTVTLTSLSLSADNFAWWTGYQGDITIPFNIGGNVSKTLYITLTGDNYSESYQEPVGTGVYTETAYNYVLAHPAKSGVYHISAYVSNSDGSLKTKTISFNVICAVAGDEVKLVAINNVLPRAVNWSENKLFEYTIYDGSNTTTSAEIHVSKDGKIIYSSDENSITTSSKLSFVYPMEIETMDNSDFTIDVTVTDGTHPLSGTISFPVDNSFGFSAVAGASFYMNPRTRNNSQSNRFFVINEVDGTEIEATWNGVNWSNDGWNTDYDGNRLLRLMSGSSLDIAYQPFSTEAARRGKTIEIDFRPDCVTNFSYPVFQIATVQGSDFNGFKIFPDDVVMYSSALKNKDDQSVNINEQKRIRMSLVIMPDAYGNSGFNLCIIYINGVKNREFTYENNDYFAQNGDIVIGSDYSDVDVYGIRIYNSALTSGGILRNYINWQEQTDAKANIQNRNDVLDVNGNEIDFEKVKTQYNVFTFDQPVPSLANPGGTTGTLELFWNEHPEWNAKGEGAPISGQGTSSMRYWRWNLRWKLAKTTVVTYADGTQTTGKWQFVPGMPVCKKLTAKKNFASSMQSHKMGSVATFNDLAKEMGITNAAHARTAVYQYPFVGFQKTKNEDGTIAYTFIGLYTLGPDKGDDNTFGYDTDAFPNLLSIEGSDNAPLFTLFRVPWNKTTGRMIYNPSEEAYQYNNVNSWDYDAGAPDSEDEPALVTAAFEKNWMPAYNFTYECSPRLMPFLGTADELNARIDNYRTQPYEFWVTGGDVYYYESSAGRFIPSDTGSGTINLYTQLVDKGYGLTTSALDGKTPAELNALFVKARIAKFRAEVTEYFDVTDAIYHRNWVEFNAATDNRAKNTYPQIFGNLTDGYRWQWRQDDMDTIWPITNQGQSKKGYWVEVGDTFSNGQPVWNGETSNFWNLIDLAFPEEITDGMRKMMTAMETLGGMNTGNSFDKIYAFFNKYYFSKAQEYFSQNLYNADAKWTYEYAKLAYNDGRYTNDTDPMTQALGDHYSAEQRWISKRILYMMSKYSYGVFSANGTDNITVRAAGDTIVYNLTPAMDMYPAIANGTSIVRGTRTKAGETCEMLIELSGSGDQQNTIQGASYLEDIGDWYNKNVTGTMIVQGRMLREIRLGSKTEPIRISITTLTLSNCVSLQNLLLSRISTLTGTLNLTSCTHLKEVYIDGTSITQLRLPDGGGLRLIEYNDLSQYLMLRNFPLLTNAGVIIRECKTTLTDFLVSNCPQMMPMQLLADIMDTQQQQGTEHALRRIRAVGFNETYHSSEILDKLANLTDGSYEGLSSDGVAGEDPIPVLDGTLNVYANVYEDSIEALREKFKKLVLNVVGEFYVRFKDPVVTSILVSHFSSDGVGLTKEDVENVTDISSYFRDNTEIETFDELEYFTNLNLFHNEAFSGCTNLKSIKLPVGPKLTIIPYDFAVHAGLEGELYIPDNYVTLGGNAFSNTKITSIKGLNHVTKLSAAGFDGCSELETIDGLSDELTAIGGNTFNNCVKLKSVITIPAGVKSLGNKVFDNCKSIPYLVFLSETPPTIGYASLGPSKIYVPDESVQAYKTATNWTGYAGRIYPLSQKPA